MTRVFIADPNAEERFALSLRMNDLHLEVVGEAADWAATVAGVPNTRADVLLVDWDILPASSRAALDELRRACTPALAILLISRLEARQQAAVSSGADTFISKAETADRIRDELEQMAASIRPRSPEAEAGHPVLSA